MKTSIKYLSDTKVEVKVTLGIEELAIAEEVALKKLGQEMKIPGFRKGKAPISAISKNVDQNILQERIINEAISNAVASSYLDNNLQALERPFVDVKKFVSKESLEFIATSEILPKIKVGDYKKLKYALDKIEVSNQEIDDVVERIRQSLSQKKEVNRPAKIDDEVVIDFVGKRNGKPFDGGTGKDYSLRLGSGQFISGFEDQLVNHKA
ncbi:MAG: trigger factor, partial [Candidatus Saccharimonadales bacterium]